jgi:hypothetical protein
MIAATAFMTCRFAGNKSIDTRLSSTLSCAMEADTTSTGRTRDVFCRGQTFQRRIWSEHSNRRPSIQIGDRPFKSATGGSNLVECKMFVGDRNDIIFRRTGDQGGLRMAPSGGRAPQILPCAGARGSGNRIFSGRNLPSGRQKRPDDLDVDRPILPKLGHGGSVTAG